MGDLWRDLLRNLLLVVLAVAAVAALALGAVFYRLSATEVTFTVKHKERVVYGDGDSRYLVWSVEGEVFENTDSCLFWKFNSSDIYGQLEEGHRYCVVVAGWRVHVLSWYRNIIRFCDEGDLGQVWREETGDGR